MIQIDENKLKIETLGMIGRDLGIVDDSVFSLNEDQIEKILTHIRITYLKN